LVEHLHGKEGVSGSSPEEGFPCACFTWRLSALLQRGVATGEREGFVYTTALGAAGGITWALAHACSWG
jgi:hypothetical protein